MGPATEELARVLQNLSHERKKEVRELLMKNKGTWQLTIICDTRFDL